MSTPPASVGLRIPRWFYAGYVALSVFLASLFTRQLTPWVLPGILLGVLLMAGVLWSVFRHEPRPAEAFPYAREWKKVLAVGFVSVFVPVFLLSVSVFGRPVPLSLYYAFSMSIPAFFVAALFHPRLKMNRPA